MADLGKICVTYCLGVGHRGQGLVDTGHLDKRVGHGDMVDMSDIVHMVDKVDMVDREAQTVLTWWTWWHIAVWTW